MGEARSRELPRSLYLQFSASFATLRWIILVRFAREIAPLRALGRTKIRG